MRLHSIIDRLRSNAQLFAALVQGVSDEQARWKPSPEEWSVLEVVNHLADEEVEDFRPRLDLTLHRPGEAWPRIDPEAWAEERRYNARDLADSVDRLDARRARSVQWLEALDEPDWDRMYEHPPLGPISAGDLLTSWVAHDLLHMRQLTRLHRRYLLERLSEHSPDYAGPW